MPMPPTDIRILVVDDMSTMRRIIRTILRRRRKTLWRLSRRG